MPDYSNSEIVDILLCLGRTEGNFRAAAQLYQARYPGRLKHPNAAVIRKIEIRDRQRPRRKRQRRRTFFY